MGGAATNIGGLDIIVKGANQTDDIGGYQDEASAFGYYRPRTQNLAFDFVELDSLNRSVRYVF